MPKLTEFAGAWQLDRRIEDAAAGTFGRLAGHARFTPCDDGLVYEEAGRLRMDGGPELEARQRHLWRPDGARVRIAFADGRPFHDFDPRQTAPEARHDCPPDLYVVAYDFTCWPDWQADWRIRGPRKSCRIVSRYGRA